ncbi:MAG: hypothetical protein AAF480_15220, partial [Actinomycetota bacterium]
MASLTGRGSPEVSAPTKMSDVRDVRPLVIAALVTGLVTFAVGVLAIDARATYGARVTADEPQYLTTALSLAEDFDLDISDEIEERAFLPYHEINLNQQTIPLNDSGQRISPHDPLLPLLLAAPMGLGGWQAAKAGLAFIAALTAAGTVALAVRRYGVRPGIAGLVVSAFFVSPPMTAYATQVYPEMPAAACVVLAFWALTAPTLRRREQATIIFAVVALPWLAVKYAPVAAVLTLGMLWRSSRRERWWQVGILTLAGIIYLVVHRRIYGGWTVYASGDHFIDGEFLVVGNNPNYVGRTRRLIGLLVDRGFGLIAWMPGFVLALPALAWFVARRSRMWPLVVATIAAGWATATWVALTMHGWWWPGRQVVVILPLVIVAVAMLADRLSTVLAATLASALIAVFAWMW